MTQEEIRHFETLGFVHYRKFFSPEEVNKLSSAFDSAMERARKGAPAPVAGESRQQVVPFFDYDPETFYPLLDDERIMDVFSTLMGEDFILTVSEGILHTGGSGWHHDACGPEGFFSMRAAMYLDRLNFEDGCLNVIPGSHFKEYRESLAQHMNEIGVRPEDIPGRYPLINEPGDIIFMNHKTYHSSLSDTPGRRAIHINCVQNTSAEKNQEHLDWLVGFLAGETKGWGRFYSERLISTAGAPRRKMLQGAIDLGFGNTGAVSHLQDLG
jgi:hypothetical protein